MQLVERHLIKSSHPYFKECDDLCFRAKNLYNCANYLYRQDFFAGHTTDANTVYHTLKTSREYKALPAKVSQNILGLVLEAWKSFRAASQSYQQEPHKFKNKPRIPGYKGTCSLQRIDGRYLVKYNYQAVSKKALKSGLAHPSGTQIYLKTKISEMKEMRILPRKGYYVIEVVYIEAEKQLQSQERIAAIDLGLNNLATLTSNISGYQPKLYDGRALKAVNQYANKKNAILRALLPESNSSSKRLNRLWLKRNCQVDYYLHTTSREIISELVQHQIGKLVIGWNPDFKEGINLGKVNNQKFVFIPHKKLIGLLQYKAALSGITVVLTEESYTSKCSALDLETLQKQEKYLGKRVKRGLFRKADGRYLNADLNGALNIGRKVVGNGFIPHPIGAVVVQPVRVKAYKPKTSAV